MTESETENMDWEMEYYSGQRLAQAYIPFQTYDEHYEPQVALKKGTLFPELYRPYRQKRR